MTLAILRLYLREVRMMKRILTFAMLVPLFACATTAPATTQSPSADVSAIRALEEQERLAVLNRDMEKLQGLWAAEFMVNSPFNQISSNRAVVVDLMRQGLIHYSSFDRNIEQLRVAGDVAIVMGAETIRPTGTATLANQTVRRRFTHIWQKHDGKWRLIARHANNIPPTLD